MVVANPTSDGGPATGASPPEAIATGTAGAATPRTRAAAAVAAPAGPVAGACPPAACTWLRGMGAVLPLLEAARPSTRAAAEPPPRMGAPVACGCAGAVRPPRVPPSESAGGCGWRTGRRASAGRTTEVGGRMPKTRLTTVAEGRLGARPSPATVAAEAGAEEAEAATAPLRRRLQRRPPPPASLARMARVGQCRLGKTTAGAAGGRTDLRAEAEVEEVPTGRAAPRRKPWRHPRPRPKMRRSVESTTMTGRGRAAWRRESARE
mmetsp:Transcript_2629/g.10173  ORF Transcript_2629/g.10173 Transcript_2629/m.10173 type:complete len:264 (+) Transcript_2629:604-1395(+)